MLTKTTNEIFKALSGLKTKRRIALTGSPIQNNLLEYFRMLSFVRPEVLGSSEAKFDKEYAEPIMRGLASDASDIAIRTSNEASKQLHNVLSPHVHRKDATVLRKELPPMQQVILHIRQTKSQARLYRAFNGYRKANGITNFFQSYQMTRPIHNHPGTLVMSDESRETEQKVYKQRSGNGKLPSEVRGSTPRKELPEQVLITSKNDVGNGTESDDVVIVELPGNSEAEDGVDKFGPTKVNDAASSEGIHSADESPVPFDSGKDAETIGSKDGSGLVEETTVGGGAATEAKCVKVSTASSATSASGLPPSGRTNTNASGGDEWWRKTIEWHGGVEKLKEVENGYKVVLLLHILVQAQVLGDKVLVFAQCLKTLDFIENVLSLDDWAEHVPSLASSCGKHGGWKKNVDVLTN